MPEDETPVSKAQAIRDFLAQHPQAKRPVSVVAVHAGEESRCHDDLSGDV